MKIREMKLSHLKKMWKENDEEGRNDEDDSKEDKDADTWKKNADSTKMMPKEIQPSNENDREAAKKTPKIRETYEIRESEETQEGREEVTNKQIHTETTEIDYNRNKKGQEISEENKKKSYLDPSKKFYVKYIYRLRNNSTKT